jgi:hypothetical protein
MPDWGENAPLVGTILSILVFCSISFLTVVKSIRFPNFNYRLEIGFPLKYYEQFYVNGDGGPNHGGRLDPFAYRLCHHHG